MRVDPYWPTRRPVRAVKQLVSGTGRPLPLPPGPKGAPVVGSWPAYRRQPYEFLRECANTYGDVFRVPLPVHDLVVVSHPDDIAHFMDSSDGSYAMFDSVKWMFDIIGNAVITVEGDQSKERRRMLLPMFSRRHLARVADTLVDEFTTRIDGWGRFADTGQSMDLQTEIAKLTLPAFLRSMFSATITEKEIHEIDVDVRAIVKIAGSWLLLCPPPNLIPLPGRDSAPKSMTRLVRLVRDLIRRRRAHPIETPDLLSILLDARHDDNTFLRESDLIFDIIVLITGGYETIVAALSWTLAHLLPSPQHLAQLYAEIDALGGRAPQVDDLANLTFTKACFDEGQRLQGAPLNWRFATRDDEIRGYPIPRGTVVATSLYTVHRDPRWWGDTADEYDPSRFTDIEQVRARPRLAFMPFGSGPHHCIGTGMAYMNAQFLMVLIFQRYRLSLPDSFDPKHQFAFSTIVEGGVPVTIERVR
ncbi:cytochrome P450 [Mycolicibacterium llatzerense]|uniref:cytochrome P450 n=1 Tax=Mycolicibacterium llatzerense TaxID=280871 RepID=UPI0009F50461|nr:cytochrome P450 [Mycolicibacterium llatzerense]